MSFADSTVPAAANFAGPGIAISFVLAGTACLFAGLCYAEFASMIPIAGSAYTYGYATMGEFIAWLIGWNLILEYLFAASTVAVGWSGYFVALMGELGISRAQLKRDLDYMRTRFNAPIDYDREANGYRFAGTGASTGAAPARSAAAITALTAQNTQGVTGVHVPDSAFIDRSSLINRPSKPIQSRMIEPITKGEVVAGRSGSSAV